MDDIKRLLNRADKEISPVKKRKLLEEALALSPNDPVVLRSLLMLGRLGLKSTKPGDVTAIKSHCLCVFDQPEMRSDAERTAAVEELTNTPALHAYLASMQDPEAGIRDYLKLLCTEYVRVFMEGDNHRNGTLLGIKVGNHTKRMAGFAANMLRQVKQAALPAPYDVMLPEALMDAFDRCWENAEEIKQLLDE